MQTVKYCFNNILFSPEQRTLELEHSHIQLDPKVADLLLFLILHHSQVLSREEILDALWKEQDVSDHVVTQTVSELRKALEKLHPEAKQWIKTISKRGYYFNTKAEIVNQNIFTNGVPITSRGYTIKKNTILFTLLFITIMIIYTIINISINKSNPKTPVLNPEGMSVLVFNSIPSLDFMAFGLSDLLNYHINTASELHSTLVFNPKSELLTSTGTILKGRLFKDEGEAFIEVIMHNNINNNEMFRKIYPLSYENLIETPEEIVRDLFPIINESPTLEKLAIAKNRYPTALPEISWMHQAHYALNQSDLESLSKSIALYEQVLQRYPDLEIAVAEQLIAIKLLRDMGDNRFSLEDLIAKNKRLTQIKIDSPPPVLHEAKAIFHFNINDLSIAQFHLNKATQTRESWLSNVIAGKIYESKSHHFKAEKSYAKAYSMKPDKGTLIAIENLLFKTDISKILHFDQKD